MIAHTGYGVKWPAPAPGPCRFDRQGLLVRGGAGDLGDRPIEHDILVR